MVSALIPLPVPETCEEEESNFFPARKNREEKQNILEWKENFQNQ